MENGLAAGGDKARRREMASPKNRKWGNLQSRSRTQAA